MHLQMRDFEANRVPKERASVGQCFLHYGNAAMTEEALQLHRRSDGRAVGAAKLKLPLFKKKFR